MISSAKLNGLFCVVSASLFVIFSSSRPIIGQNSVNQMGLAARLEVIRSKYKLPSLAAAIVSDGKLQSSAAIGIRKQGDPTPVTVQDKYHLGSCTKSMTATLVAMLVEKGKLKWETTIAEIFPEFKDEMRPEYRAVTLSMLCSHHAGLSGVTLPIGVDWRNLQMSMEKARLKYVQITLKQSPLSRPGTKFLYANSGYVIVGTILERVMKSGWENLMRTMLFEPLGMKTAGFGPMATSGKVDQPYSHIVQSGACIPVAPGPYGDNPMVIGPAGTVHCSIEDFARYAAFHAVGESGGSKLLSANGFKFLHTPRFSNDYTCGWTSLSRPWAGGKALMHNGNNTMNYAVMWVAPGKKLAIVAAANQGNGDVQAACDEAVSVALLDLLSANK